MSDGTHGHGTTIGIATHTQVGNVISISGPDQTRDAIDISTMDSSNKWREFIPGMIDAGEVTFDVNYDGSASGEANFLEAAITSTAATWTITFPDTSTWACSGFITSLGHAIPFDDKITQPVGIKFTGQPTYTDVA